MLSKLTKMFPVWAVLIGIIAYYHSSSFQIFTPWVGQLLAFVMFTMGITLCIDDFKRVFTRPYPVLVCTLLHYIIMPSVAWFLPRLFGLPPDLIVGTILVGSVASGTASNVIIYLAKGDVALSITISSISTLVGIVATPFLIWLLLGSTIQIDTVSMIKHIAMIVVLPIGLGLMVHHLFTSVIKKVEKFLPLCSMMCILFIIGVVVSGSQKDITSLGLSVIAVVMLHNLIGLAGGYWGGRLLGFDEAVCRTMAIEVGMQNSGLAASLGTKYFSALSALPAALFSIWHNISGSILAAYWQSKPIKNQPDKYPR